MRIKNNMVGLYIIFGVVLSLTHGKSLTLEDQVQVQVYYETLCPDSIAFITKQLYPAFATLGKERIDLELIPYGRATEEVVNGTKTFTCQHGPVECYGNKIHACAIDLATTVEQSTEFVFCSEKSTAPGDDENLKECAELVDMSWEDLEDCLSSGKADDLLSANGKKTDLAEPNFIPTIVLDGTYSQENQDASLLYFKKTICNLIGNPIQCRC